MLFPDREPSASLMGMSEPKARGSGRRLITTLLDRGPLDFDLRPQI